MLLWLAPLIVVVLIGAGVGAYFSIWYPRVDPYAAALETLAFAGQEGDVFLEPVGTAGPGSFAGEEFVIAAPGATLSIPDPQATIPPLTSGTSVTSPSGTPGSTTPPGGSERVVLASYPGDTRALYGGSKSKIVSDKEGELRFLERNPDKASAFCAALNSDPTLRWSGGDKVRPEQLPAYFAELTPVLLTRDTRVTNFGYKNARATPRQSVLQAGQLVLVDRFGVPRKRCECGNPLIPSRISSKPRVYHGPKWPGFDPRTVVVIQQSATVIDIFVPIDVSTGHLFARPPGSEGGSDGTPPPGPSGQNSSSPSTSVT